MSLALEPGDRVVVTGAAGFIGAAVVRALLARGAHVVALLEPGADERNLDGLDVERIVVDIRDAGAVVEAVAAARFVFHLAAMYRFWARRPQDFYDVNVGGTLNVVRAARLASCERVIYTSTVGVLGLGAAAHGRPADETSYADIAHLFGLYKRTKYVAEHEVLREAAQGAPVSLVLPTFPLGPGDRRPTPTGKVVVEFLNGRMPAFVDTTFNVVHVDDLAAGHLHALEHGRVGRSYIVGGENMPMREFLAVLAKTTGLPAPTRLVPRGVALGVGGAFTARRGPAAAPRAERGLRSRSHVDDEHDVQRPARSRRARLRPAPRLAGDRRLRPLVRRERLRLRQKTRPYKPFRLS